MLKNVPHVKRKCGSKNARETFAERNLIYFFIINFEHAF